MTDTVSSFRRSALRFFPTAIMVSGTVSLSCRAYAKVALHAAKYPQSGVCGLLLAAADSSSHPVPIVDAVPLFHQCLHVTPMAEIALTQVICLNYHSI